MDKAEIEGSAQEKRLYELIWKRTIACQMADAEIEKTTVTIGIKNQETGTRSQEEFIAQGEVVKFDGFIKVYRESLDDEDQQEDFGHTLPPLREGQELIRREINATERFGLLISLQLQHIKQLPFLLMALVNYLFVSLLLLNVHLY